MIQYTSIVLSGESGIISVRSHKGHMTQYDIGDYLRALDVQSGISLSIRFDFVDLYEDIGESSSPPVIWVWDTPFWCRLEAQLGESSRNHLGS